MPLQRFELSMLGGPVERRFRRMRPEVEAMPWDSLDPGLYSEDILEAARQAWTSAAYQEYRTGAACAGTVKRMIEAQAPVDLIAFATRFALDEMVHVELAARMAMALGGGAPLHFDPDTMMIDADQSLSPFLRAAELVVRNFCVGESVSIPLLRGTWHATPHPLAKAILGRIVKDEAAHGTFGYTYLDWALPDLDESDRAHLGRAADLAMDSVVSTWEQLRRRLAPESAEGNPLGWMGTGPYLALAYRSLESKVRAPLRARGIPLAERGPDGIRLT